MFHQGAKTVQQEKVDALIVAFGFLEKFLEDNEWLAGSTYTLADTSIISTVSSLTVIFFFHLRKKESRGLAVIIDIDNCLYKIFQVLVPLDKFPKLAAWAKRCEETIPGYATANAPGAAIFHAAAKAALNL